MHTAAGPGPFFTLASLGGLHVGILQKTDTASRLRGGHTRFGFLFNVVPDGWHLFIEHGMPTHDLTQLRSRSLRLALSASRTGWETATAIHASGCKCNRLPLRRRRKRGSIGTEAQTRRNSAVPDAVLLFWECGHFCLRKRTFRRWTGFRHHLLLAILERRGL